MSAATLADIRSHAERVTQCTLCGGREHETLSRRDRRGQPLETVICRRCGLVSHGEIPSEAALQQYYAESYRHEYNGETLPSAYRVVREWNRAGRLLKRLSPFLNAGSSVFEVGAGIGCAVKRFELAGFRSGGIEPGRNFQHYSHHHLRANVTLGVLEDVPLQATHDLVLLVHVLEHFRQPREALERIHQLLHPSGLLYIEVPNFGLPHAAPGQLFHFAHIYNFTETTLKGLAAAAGFTPVETWVGNGSRDLCVLFRATDQRQVRVDPRSYETSVTATAGRSTQEYYLRPRYLKRRGREIVLKVRERLLARRRLRKILEQCANTSPDRNDA